MSKAELCRVCGQKLPAKAKEESPWYPFCSQRCRWVDLGKWFDQEYRIGGHSHPPGPHGGNNPENQ